MRANQQVPVPNFTLTWIRLWRHFSMHRLTWFHQLWPNRKRPSQLHVPMQHTSVASLVVVTCCHHLVQKCALCCLTELREQENDSALDRNSVSHMTNGKKCGWMCQKNRGLEHFNIYYSSMLERFNVLYRYCLTTLLFSMYTIIRSTY